MSQATVRSIGAEGLGVSRPGLALRRIRRPGVSLALAAVFSLVAAGAAAEVNSPRSYPTELVAAPLQLEVDAGQVLSRIDPRIFGSNLEWFNNAGGLASSDAALRERIIDLAAAQGTTVYRFPGGILADYYNWKDGIGPRANRPTTRHPSDSGSSKHLFGSPEFFQFLERTGSEGMITVNAGTGTAEAAAEWVAYANNAGNSLRAADGFPDPIGIKLWEVGNELYLPGNPAEVKITVTPDVYAQRFVRFADAMRAVDPTITVLAIGVAKSHIGPDTQYPEWSDRVLQLAADKIDMIAVHNAYFPMLYKVRQPSVEEVYPPLWASPEATDESLTALEALISRHERSRPIGIAITEWGALFSLPRADPYWTDHVKTLGSAVYVARMLQVFMSHPRVQVANYFKLVDRSFMGWIDLNGQPKVPYEVFGMMARNTGDQRLQSRLATPRTYDAPQFAVMKAQNSVPEVTALASRDSASGRIFVNLVNRSLSRQYSVNLNLKGTSGTPSGKVLSVSADEPTAHNGRDIPPEWPYKAEYEPYSSAPAHSIGVQSRVWHQGERIDIPPFSVLTLALDPVALK